MPYRKSSLGLLIVLCSAACTSTVSGTDGAGTTSADGGSQFQHPGTPPPGGDSSDAGPQANEYEALFGPPATSTMTENKLEGLWAGKTSYYDMRIKLSPSSVTIAVQCTGRTIGATFSAQVSSSSIRLRESKQVGEEWDSCSIKVSPQAIPQCDTTKTIECFELEGSTLSFEGIPVFTAGGYMHQRELTKLSD